MSTLSLFTCSDSSIVNGAAWSQRRSSFNWPSQQAYLYTTDISGSNKQSWWLNDWRGLVLSQSIIDPRVCRHVCWTVFLGKQAQMMSVWSSLTKGIKKVSRVGLTLFLILPLHPLVRSSQCLVSFSRALLATTWVFDIDECPWTSQSLSRPGYRKNIGSTEKG